MRFIHALLQKYNIVTAKTKYLEEQVDEMQKKLAAFKKAKPKLLASVAKNEKMSIGIFMQRDIHANCHDFI